MPGSEIVPVKILAENFYKLQLELRAQSLPNYLRPFSGKGNHKFSDWIRDLEHVGLLCQADYERLRNFCLMSVTGPASNYVIRYIKSNPTCSWRHLKSALKIHFSDLSDIQFAKKKLLSLKQNFGESVQTYGDRILSTAEDAYTGDELVHPIIQGILKDVFMDGLREHFIIRKLIRDQPLTLEESQVGSSGATNGSYL
ncbi:hypothetical protein LOTGIDRAFT_164095 [Lottia gigantea]|uniref:Retrotransposon gag domain-containing protein n=1 Tax=Lottia gigantea TaxID=225164 RepID=V4A681_LOTGI|nr:hypothetical protein LOTGIDRAFT_164095 [Lottia gigantea]ESO90510.1 hypothetical protein LOTGIDRAFT_164095 [Lottia gigantea]